MSVKTFFEHIFDFLKDHLGTAASFEHTASVALSVATPLLEELVTLVAGDKVEAKVAGVVTQVTTDLNNTSAILNGAATTGDITLTGLLDSVKANLSSLIADADVKNSAKASQITSVASTVIGEVEAVLAAIPADYATPVHGAPTAA